MFFVQIRKIILTSILLVYFSKGAFATHIFGGELLYTWLSGNTYRLTLTMYGDCSGAAFSFLPSSRPQISIYNNGLMFKTIVMDTVTGSGSGIEVSPVCPGQLKNTSCNGGTLPGVKKFVYSDTVTLPVTSTNWSFIFDGNFSGTTGAGRSNNITNVTSGSLGLVYLIATLNNAVSPNNSPQYTTIPTPFYCINLLQQYNQGAIDPDGDSLLFTLTPALNAGSPVTYISPYTYSLPLGADTFSFNSFNGQMVFLPNIVQDALVVTKVSEYRGGVLVGTSMREMTFIVLSTCNNEPPKANISSLTGGYNKGNIITLCQGTPLVSFNINAYDSSGDTILATPVSVPPAASLTVSNNNTPNPTLAFSWNTGGLANGIYNFYINYKNFHCPISSSQTLAYTLLVVPPYSISSKVLYPTQCLHQAYIELDLTDGAIPRVVTIMKGSTTIKTYTDSTGIIRDSIAAGNYSVIVNSENNTCPVSYSFSVPDSGVLPDPYITPITYCKFDPSVAIQLPFVNGSNVQWYDANKILLTSPPIPSTTVPGIYTWYVSEEYKACATLMDSVQVTIYDLPHVSIVNTKEPICLGDKIELDANGGVGYQWKATNNRLYNAKDSDAYSLAYDTATYKVIVTNQYNCEDSASVSYTNIQQCCQFSYPNAFSPNNDGKNDEFRILTYGNLEGFYLEIFNRWGQVVYTSVDPKLGWDGNFRGKPCDVGTYFYLLRAQCLTGHYEEHKGDLTLIR